MIFQFNPSLKKSGSLLFLVCLCLPIAPMAETDVYVTRDADGNPVFSDTPSGDAEKIVVDELQTIPKDVVDPASISNSNTKIKELAKYNHIKITNPAHDQAIRDNSGSLNISLSLEPALRGNDKIVIYMNGSEVSRGSATSVALNAVDRGTHNISAVVVSPDGKTLIRSDAVTVHLLRVSVQH